MALGVVPKCGPSTLPTLKSVSTISTPESISKTLPAERILTTLPLAMVCQLSRSVANILLTDSPITAGIEITAHSSAAPDGNYTTATYAYQSGGTGTIVLTPEGRVTGAGTVDKIALLSKVPSNPDYDIGWDFYKWDSGNFSGVVARWDAAARTGYMIGCYSGSNDAIAVVEYTGSSGTNLLIHNVQPTTNGRNWLNGEQHHVQVCFRATRGFLFVDNNFIGSFDASAHVAAGNVGMWVNGEGIALGHHLDNLHINDGAVALTPPFAVGPTHARSVNAKETRIQCYPPRGIATGIGLTYRLYGSTLAGFTPGCRHSIGDYCGSRNPS
jgi:hypothetical protein